MPRYKGLMFASDCYKEAPRLNHSCYYDKETLNFHGT
jgi:hypothetical protein